MQLLWKAVIGLTEAAAFIGFELTQHLYLGKLLAVITGIKGRLNLERGILANFSKAERLRESPA